MTDLETRRLRYFLEVASHLHFGRAAEKLHIAQPALSQQIKLLESHLGVQLLERSTRSVKLTAAGRRLAERGRHVLAEFDACLEEVTRIGRGELGRVRIGFIGSATYWLMPQVARALRARLPDINVELHGEQLSAPLALALHEGRVDVAVLRPCAEATGLNTAILQHEPVVVAVPEGHALAERAGLSFEDLYDQDLVSYPASSSVVARKQREFWGRAKREQRIVATVAETSTLATFVASALGIAVVPRGVETVRIPGVRYIPVTPEVTLPLLVAVRAGHDPVVERVLAEVLTL